MGRGDGGGARALLYAGWTEAEDRPIRQGSPASEGGAWAFWGLLCGGGSFIGP